MMDYSAGFGFYVHDHLYSPAVLVRWDGTILERYEYDAYGNCSILEPNFAPDPDGKSDYGNPYLFTGRRLDILDNGSLKIQYNRNRYYDYYTGRWLTHDPLEYVDGMNLYEYGKSNPIIYVDPLGLWKVNRSGSAKASAEAEEGDTIRILADKVGFEVWQWRNWLTIPKDKICTVEGPLTEAQLTADTEICLGEKVKVPNTVIAYWAGELGFIGKLWVGWWDDVGTLKERGFYVDETEGYTAIQLECGIDHSQENKKLHGIFAWGHGGFHYFVTDASHRGESGYYSFYEKWKPKYKMALGIIWACHSITAKPHFSSNGIFQGHKGILLPWPFHWYGPTVDQIIKPGQQETKGEKATR